jgi:OOP family OmpA-OmpF porin
MTVGKCNLTVFSAALLCFGSSFSSATNAASQSAWYSNAFARILRFVSADDANATSADNGGASQAYVSRIIKDDNTIVLKGDVPSDGDLKILQGVAAATSPRATLVDKSNANANVPDRDTWLAAMTFALRQLGKLDHGSAVLCNSAITIDGVLKAENDFASFQKKLKEEAPKGVTLQIGLKPHEAHPFIWTAQLQPGGVSLTGHVPNEQDQIISDYAQTIFTSYKINNNMSLAAGEPKEWLTAAKLSLDMLGLLYSGSVTLTDTVIRVDGIFSSPTMAESIRSYAARLPRGFKLETNVIEPVAGAASIRTEDVTFAVRATPASLNP